jgi:2-keto-4-pentenoate hydratase/2-oxohepta-3-ene-1,7-dioic acid hydratase in catechol pathway
MKTVFLQGSDEPIRVEKIFCLGRNYVAHAMEMSAEVGNTPVVFLKPPTALVEDGASVVIPRLARELHHEVEMVVLIGKGGKYILKENAYDHVAGYAVGLDMTLRDLQAEAKKKGLPWSVAKGFDTSAPISTVVNKSQVRDPHNLNISLKVNGQLRQQSNTRHMVFQTDTVIAFLSSIFTLEPGDLIFTGTPEGVGAVYPGDILEAELESVGRLRVTVAKA